MNSRIILFLILVVGLSSCGVIGHHKLDLHEFSNSSATGELSIQGKTENSFAHRLDLKPLITEKFELNLCKHSENLIQEKSIENKSRDLNEFKRKKTKHELKFVQTAGDRNKKATDPTVTNRLFMWGAGFIVFALVCVFIAFRTKSDPGLLTFGTLSWLSGIAALIFAGIATKKIVETDKEERTNFQKFQLIFNILHFIVGSILAVIGFLLLVLGFAVASA